MLVASTTFCTCEFSNFCATIIGSAAASRVELSCFDGVEFNGSSLHFCSQGCAHAPPRAGRSFCRHQG